MGWGFRLEAPVVLDGKKLSSPRFGTEAGLAKRCVGGRNAMLGGGNEARRLTLGEVGGMALRQTQSRASN